MGLTRTITLSRQAACIALLLAFFGLFAGTPHHLATDHSDCHGQSDAIAWCDAPHGHGHELGDHDLTGTRRPVYTFDLVMVDAEPLLLPPAPSPKPTATDQVFLTSVWHNRPTALRGPPASV